MVALLMSEGNAEAALQLEVLWNNLARTHSFSLLCAYPINSFRGEGNSSSLLHVCNAHARVVPAESYAGKSDPDDQRRAVTLLQQQASSLESEIAERKHAQALMRAEETKLNLAVALAQLGLWEFDIETKSLMGSEPCKAHLGLNPEEPLTCERFFELVHPEDRAGVRSALEAAVDDRADYKAEYRVMDAAGHVRWISAMGRCLHNGTPRLLGVIRDITEQKQAAELLERTVAERTAQLRETVGELEAFSYSISHDMRSPLRAMEGYAKALLEDYGSKLDGQALLCLERIKRASNRLDLLIRDILSYSKVAKGAIELKPIALTPLVDDLIHQRPEFDRVRGSILVEKPLHSVLAHESYLTQILTNLIGNALKFIAAGTVPEVRIRSELSGEKVRVSVIDNGIGIHPDHHNRIFQIFGRVYSEKSYEGTGIGLAIVKKAVARMGGETGFQSVLGRGSDFWFLLRGADNGC
jgi:PAS domain S-box-containing protein